MNSYKFNENSYNSHAEHIKEYTLDSEKAKLSEQWLKKDTVDYWCHSLVLNALDPILLCDTKAKWFTVGDGRYGNDAKYIIDNNGDALATDITDVLLKKAKEVGYIEKYKVENAECLTFSDSSFDYALCKESYHHFPRPIIALYEMLRVARKGVVLIEPNDIYANNNISNVITRNIRFIAKFLMRREKVLKHSYEESGNYIYSISKREMEKVALGLNYQLIAFKGINTAYFTGVEYEKISENGVLYRKIKKCLRIANFLSKLKITEYSTLATIIFKEIPSLELRQMLIEKGYKIITLPKNPYI